jgi:hypothetical protein
VAIVGAVQVARVAAARRTAHAPSGPVAHALLVRRRRSGIEEGMTTRVRRRRFLVAGLVSLSIALGAPGCGGDDDSAGAPATFAARVDTTRVCALVPARDPAAAAFPPEPPVRAFGTDLGWTYELNGRIMVLFGDTWQRIDICPLQVNDDSLATMEIPADDWPGFTSRGSIPDAECPELTFALDAAGTAFGPIVLQRWDGTPVPLGPLNTPVTGFYDGRREWAVFIVGGGQACTPQEAASGAVCPDDLSPQAEDLVCDTVGSMPRCIDPASTRSGDSRLAYYLHVAERVGPTSYVTRAMFLTNKYLNLTARPVRSFDPDSGEPFDYRAGTSALLVWGRPGFDDQAREGEMPPYFLYHPLPFEFDGDQIVFEPRFFTGAPDGSPQFGDRQKDAVPLYTGEIEPVNHAAVSWIEPLSRWFTIYGGSVVDYTDPNDIAGESQPVRGAMYGRFAPDPWGPWTEAQVAMPEEVVAQDMACGKRAPAGCTANPASPSVRPACIELFDGHSGAALYGANIIDSFTRAVTAETTRGPAADVFWLLSTWNPYSVVLVKSRVELD